MSAWKVEIYGQSYARFYRSLSKYQQLVVDSAIRNVLSVEGIGICSGEWGKPLGGGLYEFRIRKSLHAIESHTGPETSTKYSPESQVQVLIRIFCTFHGDKIVVLHHGYDKKRDSSEKKQQQEIRTARKLHQEWKQGLK
ncbi:hypothetical protein [Aurantimicrobium minutum]|uniref:hypothetical protein n=1 Tax=Aurantimicrobium minutum TaxID=708131 RepID=UPI0024756D88|nr:hypothetical protein [Aurantimicrobium minutum]MDH6422938.1 hypothetical protein [Aurantimicrobium minutum]